ncbi:MAG: RloB domain-containing protein [Luteolibacter sp.]
MSRSNPRKPKPRTTRATAQIVCEGFTEEAFCKYLKSLYARDCGVSVAIHNARGGSPQDIIKTALNRKGYDRTVVLFDADKPLPDSWRKKSRSAGHHLVIADPCIEGLLLAILRRPVPDTTNECKRALDALLQGASKNDPKNYATLLPKSLLDEGTHPQLLTLRKVFSPDP